MSSAPFYILSLDGGGSLGVYTLGVLAEVELILPSPLHSTFDLIYGTSTGSIIGSMIALGDDIRTIRERYLKIVPDVMNRPFARRRSVALERWSQEVYEAKQFDSFMTNVGIVATHLEFNRPMVFKNYEGMAHGSTGSFEPGFGCSIADAVVASCAAFPLFRKKRVLAENSGERTIVDGGYSANNPSLFALTDALGSLGVSPERIRLFSVGTGSFPVKHRLWTRLTRATAPTFVTLLQTSSNTVETLRPLLFPTVATLRVNDTWSDDKYRTDFIESDREKLGTIYQLGRSSFANHEHEIRSLFEAD